MNIVSLLFFTFGVVFSQKISIFGEVYLGEIFCAILIIFNVTNIKIYKEQKLPLFLLFLWFFAQLISDISNSTDLLKSVKGTLVPIFIGIIFLGLNSLFNQRLQFLPVFFVGLVLGILINKYLLANSFLMLNPWKWGWGLCFSFIFFAYIDFFKVRKSQILAISGVSLLVCISFLNSSRSIALIVLISFLLVSLSRSIVKTSIFQYLSSRPMGHAQLFFVFIACAYSFDSLFSIIFTYQPILEMLPPEDALKYQIQAQSKWGVLLGGRSESIISLQAFGDSPILGHGSWAENRNYVLQYLRLIDLAGSSQMSFEVMKENIHSYLIPTHSYLMGALVWGGIFSGLYWIYILRTIFKGFLDSMVIQSPLLVFSSVFLIWNILFSPFGADARWLSSVLIWTYFNYKRVSRCYRR